MEYIPRDIRFVDMALDRKEWPSMVASVNQHMARRLDRKLFQKRPVSLLRFFQKALFADMQSLQTFLFH